MWHHNIQQETAVSIIRAEGYKAWEEMVSNTKNRGHWGLGKNHTAYSSILKKKAAGPPKSWCRSIKLHASHPRGQHLHSRCCDNLKLSKFWFKHPAWKSYHLIQFSTNFQLKKLLHDLGLKFSLFHHSQSHFYSTWHDITYAHHKIKCTSFMYF
jgi:hypothetical protein